MAPPYKLEPIYPREGGNPIQLGDDGPAVAQLQRGLNDLGNRLKVDGKFGVRTGAVVESYQRRRGLGTDGTVDRVMWHLIFGLAPPRLHSGRHESARERLRRVRIEIRARGRQLSELPAGRRRKAVKARRNLLQRVAGKTAAAIEQDGRPRRTGPNTVVGGKAGERVAFALRLALAEYRAGRRPSFYSQAGYWLVTRALTGEPSGARSDCSQWWTSILRACGLPDPNGMGYVGGGYTGTLARVGRRVSGAEAIRLIREGRYAVASIWDPEGDAGHIEGCITAPTSDPLDIGTIGHGSAPIAAHTVRTFSYKPLQGFYVFDQGAFA